MWESCGVLGDYKLGGKRVYVLKYCILYCVTKVFFFFFLFNLLLKLYFVKSFFL